MSAVSAPTGQAPADVARGQFFGSTREYWRILSRDAPALIATLGLYRFWVSTDVRRYLWSHTNLAGEQLDYTGDPLELLVGFLVLLVVLAPLAAIVSVLGIITGNLDEVAYLPLVMLLPLGILALYQARRYRVNNTVFRGLRFHQTGSAWVYALLTLLWLAVVVVTLGLSYPWARAGLERYKMRHTFYGDVQGSFEGSGWVLFKRGAALWAAVAAGALLLGLLHAGATPDALVSAMIVASILGVLAYPVFRAMGLRWRIAGMRFGTLSLTSDFSTRSLYKAYLKLFGWLALLAIIIVLVALAQLATVSALPLGKSVVIELIWVVCLMIAYFALATAAAFAYQGTVRFDTWRLIVDALVLRGLDQLDRAKSRPAGRAPSRPHRRRAQSRGLLMDPPTQGQGIGQGIYFDGVTGVPRSVTLTLEETTIAIESPNGVPLAHWDYSAIQHWPSRRERLRLGLANSPSTARLEVLDPACADVIKSRLGFGAAQEEVHERRRRHRVVEWTIAAAVAVAVIGVAGLPAFARLLLPLIPLSAEAWMGLQAHLDEKRRFDEKNERFECGDAGQAERAGKAVFLQMFRRLEQAAALPIPLHPYVIGADEINANAFPGGYVHVNMGLINAATSPDELAGVIAHEIGHVAHRDDVGSALHAAGVSFLFGMVLGDLLGSPGVTLAALKLFGNTHTRAQEAAADAFGVELMRKLGADPHAVATPFETWEKQQPQERHRDILLLRDHPTDAARIKSIRSTPAVANPKPLLTLQEWQTLKQVCSGR